MTSPLPPLPILNYCLPGLSCQTGTDGIPSTACATGQSCKPTCPMAPPAPQKKGLTGGDIAAIIFGILLLIAIIIIILLFMRKPKAVRAVRMD